MTIDTSDIEETGKLINHDWKPGDDPETHPMWDEQVQLEYGMMRSGAKKLQDRVITAKGKDRMTDLTQVRGLADDWVPGVADAIKGWLRMVEGSKGGPKPIAYPLIKAMDPYLAAMVGTRAILNHIAKETYTLANVALEIGTTLEHEQKVREWEKENPKDFWKLQQEMERKKVTKGHLRRTNINRFSNHMDKGTLELTWKKWSSDQRFRVGWTIMDLLIKHTGWFEVVNDPSHQFKKGSWPALAITVKPGLMDWLAKKLDHAEVNTPDFKPTVVPPKRWSTTRDGGYWTPYVKTPRLVRFKASQELQKRGAADEYDAFDMPKVYSALNVLQETAWCINQRVLDVALTSWAERGLLIKGMPELFERELPPRTPRMIEHRESAGLAKALHGMAAIPDDQTQKEIDEWKRKAHPVYAFNAKRIGRKKLTDDMLAIAKEYRDYDEFFFPHMLDFRGRMYPIPAFLQPQGNDLARGLLTFSGAAPITLANGGVRWLAIHLASNWGHDKLPYDDRVKWVYDNEVLLRLIAANPDGNREWAQADKPWQALAAIFEWVDYLDHGDGFMSSLPVMVDGTCNGIQHLSALTRDRVAGGYVNLVPSERPQDIYKFVADNLQAKLLELVGDRGENWDVAQWWLDLCPDGLPRSLTKRQVMVLPYGGTRDSFFGYTRDWLKEYHPKLTEELDEQGKEDIKARIVLMSNEMWKAVNEVVFGGMRVMKWLQDMAKQAAIADQPIYWKVPSGFIVRQFYGLNKEKRVDLLLDGTRCRIHLSERTAELSVREQTQGISPNFIHSLDAACLCECLNRCEELGIKSFASVHDAYGTHAANMDTLADLLRESFVHVHEHDLLGGFRAAICSVVSEVSILEKGLDPQEAWEKAEEQVDMKAGRLEMGDLELREVLESPYFFA